MESLFLLMALMALARVKTPEALRYNSPGEWGKLLGLDRIPGVRTLRERLRILAQEGQVDAWSARLSRRWMSQCPENALILYIDGHVRVCFGEQTKLPRHYFARERLCLRATADYWVNAWDGQPFFVITKEVDPGLIQVLEQEVIPRLKVQVPDQPTKEAVQSSGHGKQARPSRRSARAPSRKKRFSRLATESKHLIDTIKMLAYRAETAMTQVVRENMAHQDEARQMIQTLFQTEANLRVDETEGTSEVQIHHMANQASDCAIMELCEQLNETNTIFPGSDLRLIYSMGSPSNP